MKIIEFPKKTGAPWYVGKNTWRKMTPGQRIEFQSIREASGKCFLEVGENSVTIKKG